jgi:hypothetical protein
MLVTVLLKVRQAVRHRGLHVVLRQFLAQMLLQYAPVPLFSGVVLPMRAFLLVGYFPNLKNPRTFNEKILHRRQCSKDPRAAVIADKWLVRQCVREKGLEGILNEVYCVTDDPASIDFGALPDRFVIKANYASGMNIVVRNKGSLNTRRVATRCTHWIRGQRDILRRNPETHYRDIRPLVLVEKFLDSSDPNGLADYKFWCFAGRVHFVNVQSVVNGARITSMYDRDWVLQPFTTNNKPVCRPSADKPTCLGRMVEIAETLSAGFSFLRVDLYRMDDDTVIFGELSYNPGGGTSLFFPREYDLRLGKLLEL